MNMSEERERADRVHFVGRRALYFRIVFEQPLRDVVLSCEGIERREGHQCVLITRMDRGRLFEVACSLRKAAGREAMETLPPTRAELISRERCMWCRPRRNRCFAGNRYQPAWLGAVGRL